MIQHIMKRNIGFVLLYAFILSIIGLTFIYLHMITLVWNLGEFTVLLTIPQLERVITEIPLKFFFIVITLPLFMSLSRFLPLSLKGMIYAVWKINNSLLKTQEVEK